MSKKKVLVILGSKSDELTAKLLKSFDNCLINYMLIDFQNFKIFYSYNKSSINIKKNFSVKNLLDYIQQVDRKIKFKRDCIFLFEFCSGFNKNVSEYELSLYVQKKNFQRFFYNRRSFSLVYFITDDFYGLSKNFSTHKIKYDINRKLILSKISGVRDYKLKFDPLMQTISKKKYLIKNLKIYIRIIFYSFRYLHYSLLLVIKKIFKIRLKKKIFFITPKQRNFFLEKTNSKFSNLGNLLPIISFLSFFYELTICVHPKNKNSWLISLLKFWGIKTVTSIYSKEARNLIDNSQAILTLGSSSVVEALLSSKVTLEIGKTPRVSQFKGGYNFLSEDNMTLNKIKLSIEKILNFKKKVIFKVPNFCSVYYPSFQNNNLGSFVKNTGTKSIVSNLEVNYLKNFILKKLSIKNKYRSRITKK
mgnify:CR=1 FL=1|tara:strand:+ start:1804 stop:3057 length:1254 start_codon:yes stop_codon:yes gene_type:complete